MTTPIEVLVEELCPDKPWKWGRCGLSSNPSIPPEFIVKHKDRAWDWKRLSNHYTFSVSDWAWRRRKDALHVFRSIGQRWRKRQKWVVEEKVDDERQARLGALLQRLAVSRTTEEGEVVAIIGRQVSSFL